MRQLIRSSYIRKYFKQNKVPKLQIGSGSTALEGWLCTDLIPGKRGVVYLDATKKFPFKDNTFQYVFSEHMIEHVSHSQGLAMLKECFRVMKPGGCIRIATPDLKQVARLYTDKDSDICKDYIKWSMDKFANEERDKYGYNNAIVVNYFFHKWGHQFIYDEEILKKTMLEAGFKQPVKMSIHHSEKPELNQIENHHIAVGSDEMITFETLVVEAVK